MNLSLNLFYSQYTNLTISNTFANIEDNSTWSLDIFSDDKKMFAACGSNNKKISVISYIKFRG